MAGNIIICGLPGSGKTETAKAIATTLIWEYVDTDEYVENLFFEETSEKATRREIFKKLGDYGFRKMENQVLTKLSNLQNLVISLGGGTVTSKENKGLVKALGTIIYLTNDRKVIYERLMNKGGMPAYLNPEAPFESFELLAEQREPVYEAIADIKFNTGTLTPLEAASQITSLLLKQEG